MNTKESIVHGMGVLPVALAALFAWPLAAFAQVAVWHNTLEDDTATTIDGGVLMGNPPTYAAGQVSPPLTTTNKFVSTGLASWVEWETTEVLAIFDPDGDGTGWTDDDGITVDLYFSGFDSSVHAGCGDENCDSGLWSVGHRISDNFVLVGVRNGQVRINFRNDAGGSPTHSATAGGGFIETETYRLTLRQHSSLAGGAELYLDDLGGNVFDGATPLALAWDTPLPDGYIFNFPLEEGGGPGDDPLGMSIGNRRPFMGDPPDLTALNFGESVDEVRIFNGSYTPAQLDAPAIDPDFDDDGDVDGNDFLVWQRGESPDSLSASDLDAWKANFGSVGAALSAAIGAVPEPSAMGLLVLGSVGLMLSRRKSY